MLSRNNTNISPRRESHSDHRLSWPFPAAPGFPSCRADPAPDHGSLWSPWGDLGVLLPSPVGKDRPHSAACTVDLGPAPSLSRTLVLHLQPEHREARGKRPGPALWHQDLQGRARHTTSPQEHQQRCGSQPRAGKVCGFMAPRD